MIENLINIKIKNKETGKYFVFDGTSILTVHIFEPVKDYLEFKKNGFLTSKYDREDILSKYNFPLYGFKVLRNPINQLSTILEREIPLKHKPTINPKEPNTIRLDNVAFDFIVAYFASKDPALKNEYDYLLDYLLKRLYLVSIKIEDEDYYKKTTKKIFRDLPSDNITEYYYRNTSVNDALEISNTLLGNHYPSSTLQIVQDSNLHSLTTFIDNPLKYGIEIHVKVSGNKQPIWYTDNSLINSIWKKKLNEESFVSKVKNSIKRLLSI